MDVTSDEFKDSVVPAVKRSLFTGLSIKCDGAKTIMGCLRSDDVCDQANNSGLCSIMVVVLTAIKLTVRYAVGL